MAKKISPLKKLLKEMLLKGAYEKEILAVYKGTQIELLSYIESSFTEYNFFPFGTLRNGRHEMFFKIFPKTSSVEHNEPIWTYVMQKNNQPWIWIKFPDALPWKKIEIEPLSDVHIGARAHNEKAFDEAIGRIEKKPQRFTFLNGDIIENSLGTSVGGSVYEQNLQPSEQVEIAIEKLRPIAHKILWAQPGNHEWRSKKVADIDPLQWICRVLKVPYFSEPLYADIFWGDKSFTFYAHHGATGSQTAGGKINSAIKPLKFQQFCMFTIMGHVHDKKSLKKERIVRVPSKRQDDGTLSSDFSLQKKKEYIVICPSYYGYFRTYASRQGYIPAFPSSNIVLEIFKDGDYHVDDDKPSLDI